MAIYFCKKCNVSKETKNEYIGKKSRCPVCDSSIMIYDTVQFVNQLARRYLLQGKELKLCKEKNNKEIEIKKPKQDNNLQNINIHNTKELITDNNYKSIKKWFQVHNLEIEMDKSSIDTTGFFDEIAVIIGDNYKVLKLVIEQIKYIQNKDYTNVKIKLENKSAKDIRAITSFCNELYKYSFIAKYFYDKKIKVVRLSIQQAPKIKEFFNGIWMEWFIMMKLLNLFKSNNLDISIIRNIKIKNKNGQFNELDIFLLTKDNTPIYIECKSGEFRQDINKYINLQQKLGLKKENFIICILGLSQTDSNGLTSMYDMKFIDENNIANYIKEIIA